MRKCVLYVHYVRPKNSRFEGIGFSSSSYFTMAQCRLVGNGVRVVGWCVYANTIYTQHPFRVSPNKVKLFLLTPLTQPGGA